jgi:hypothetical protein
MLIIAKELTKTIWAKCISKGMFAKTGLPILGL